MSLSPLVTASEVADRSFRTFTDVELMRVGVMTEDVSALIRNYTRQTFTAERATERLRPVGYRIRLPHTPVTEIHSVNLLVEGVLTPTLGYFWDGLNEIRLGEGQIINLSEAATEWLAIHTPVAEVDYSFGYAEVPADIKSVACSIILRTMSAPGGGGIISEAVGEYTYRLSDAAAQGPLSMTEAEKAILAAHRRPAATIELR